MFSVILLVRYFYGRKVPFLVQLFEDMFLFPFSGGVGVVYRRLMTVVFFFLVFLLQYQLAGAETSAKLLSTIVIGAGVFDGFSDDFPRPSAR